jgi:hypothetical protein
MKWDCVYLPYSITVTARTRGMEQFKFWFISRRLARHLMTNVWSFPYFPTRKRVFENAVAVAIAPGIKVVAVVKEKP